jgi:hypothetical protein
MKVFEQLHIEDQLQLALEALRMMFDGKCCTLEKLAQQNDQTPLALWCDVCAEVGFDVCEPWEGFPAGPKKENWAKAPGADRPMPDYYQKLLDHWKQTLPHMIGRQ